MVTNLESEGALIAIIQNKNKSMKDKKLYITSDESNVKMDFQTMNVIKTNITISTK